MTALLLFGSTISFALSLLFFAISRQSIHEAIAALFIVCSAILFSAAAIIMAIHRHQLKMMESFSRVMTIMEYQPPATTSAPPPSPPQDWVAQAKAESVAAQR